MTFKDAIRYGFKNYANFSGVVGRSTFWYWYLFTFLCYVPITILQQVLSVAYIQTNNFVFTLLTIPLGFLPMALFLPTLALMIRRLRDSGKSPLYLLVWLAPIVLAIVFAVFGTLIALATGGGSSSSTGIYVGIGSLIGMGLGWLGAGVLLIVFLAQPTKTRAQGNKYALV